MEINVNIKADENLTQAIVKFADAIELVAKKGIGNVLYNNDLIEQIVKEVKNEVSAPGVKAPVDTAEEVVEKTETAVETKEKDKVEPNTNKVIKLEEERAKLASLSKAGKKTEVKKLLNSFGVQKLTDVPADKYEELLEKAEEL